MSDLNEHRIGQNCDAHAPDAPLDHDAALAWLKDRVRENAADLQARRASLPNVPGERYSSLLFENDAISVYLLQWPRAHPGTEIHNHGDASAAVAVLSGTVKESVYGVHPDSHTRTVRELPEGAFLAIPTPYVHKFEDASETGTDALTLHVYSPPLRKMEFFAWDNVEKILSRTGEWDETVHGKIIAP